jgi:hypothetical protein
MNPDRRKMLAINLVGGVAVLGSYAYGLATHPEIRGQVWGGVPDSLRPFYSVSMLLAAAGYFAFSYFVFFRLDPKRTRVGSSAGLSVFNLLYVLILLPSALWMPLTFAMIEAPGAALWWAIRLVLCVAGAASLGMLAAILKAQSPGANSVRWLAVLGSALFCVQTALLDAVVWPVYFPY